ncbi:hypothetical protein CKA32_003337 [Geitlerinema sp. FC II]|nr:hypothetical protein CKA32_003337 [Geitlerinema sp. FC II]
MSPREPTAKIVIRAIFYLESQFFTLNYLTEKLFSSQYEDAKLMFR